LIGIALRRSVMLNTLDFTKNIRNPYIQSLCDEVIMPFNHELMVMLENIAQEKGLSITNLLTNCIYRYLVELGEEEDIEAVYRQYGFGTDSVD
jgi:hypothetical protein